MGLFGGSGVIEWEEYRDDIVFWKWADKEIKKGSRLVVKQGQDAIFLYNGRIEGIFEDEGIYDIESQIVPLLSSLSGFRFGFGAGIRAEVLFINTKEFTLKWGTKNPIIIPAAGIKSGMPVRAFGTFSCKVCDSLLLIDKVAGIKRQFSIDEVRERVLGMLDQLMMKWIAKEGKDMFDLQANAADISNGIKEDLDMELMKIGVTITSFKISSFSYPEGVQKIHEQIIAESMEKGMAGAQSAHSANYVGSKSSKSPKFCPECGTPTNGAKFCPECGNKLI